VQPEVDKAAAGEEGRPVAGEDRAPVVVGRQEEDNWDRTSDQPLQSLSFKDLIFDTMYHKHKVS